MQCLNMSGVKLKSQVRAGVPGQPLQPSDGARDGMNLRVSLRHRHPVFSSVVGNLTAVGAECYPMSRESSGGRQQRLCLFQIRSFQTSVDAASKLPLTWKVRGTKVSPAAPGAHLMGQGRPRWVSVDQCLGLGWEWLHPCGISQVAISPQAAVPHLHTFCAQEMLTMTSAAVLGGPRRGKGLAHSCRCCLSSIFLETEHTQQRWKSS